MKRHRYRRIDLIQKLQQPQAKRLHQYQSLMNQPSVRGLPRGAILQLIDIDLAPWQLQHHLPGNGVADHEGLVSGHKTLEAKKIYIRKTQEVQGR